MSKYPDDWTPEDQETAELLDQLGLTAEDFVEHPDRIETIPMPNIGQTVTAGVEFVPGDTSGVLIAVVYGVCTNIEKGSCIEITYRTVDNQERKAFVSKRHLLQVGLGL